VSNAASITDIVCC